MSKVIYRQGENIIVWRLGKTTNKKIAPEGMKVLQTYTFSVKQWEAIHREGGVTMKEFFALDGSNCLDCPFSGNQGKGGCYTHKGMQYMGFKSMLRSIRAVEQFTEEKRLEILKMAKGAYVRFGTYGEPSLLGEDLVAEVCSLASSWTGYTHQHAKDWAQPYSKFFMASVHSAEEAHEKTISEWRSFAVVDAKSNGLVGCPASKEGGFKSNCASCGLCSGTTGKGKKSVQIIQH